MEVDRSGGNPRSDTIVNVGDQHASKGCRQGGRVIDNGDEKEVRVASGHSGGGV